MLKKLLFCLLLVAFSVQGFSQFSQRQLPPNLSTYDDAPYHFGFTLSVGSCGLAVKTVEDYYNNISYNYEGRDVFVDYLPANATYRVSAVNSSFISPSFAVGIVANFRLGNYFDFRVIPGLSFTQHKMQFTILQNPGMETEKLMYSPEGNPFLEDKVECVFLDFPVMIKYKGKRIHNMRPYVIGGMEGKVNFLAGVGYADHTTQELSSLKLNRFDLMGTVGAGMDFYMFWFKLGVELRMGYSLFNCIDRLDGKHFCTNTIENVKSKQFQVVFTFE